MKILLKIVATRLSNTQYFRLFLTWFQFWSSSTPELSWRGRLKQTLQLAQCIFLHTHIHV